MMTCRVFCYLLLFSSTLAAQSDVDLVARQGLESEAGRAAWKRLKDGGPELLVPILNAMPADSTPAVNWLATAYDRILQRHPYDKLPLKDLTEFAADPKKSGRARRLALETVEKIKPGSSEQLYPKWLHDPEFRYEAVQQVLEQAKKSGKVELYQTAWNDFRDVQQGREIAAGLKTHGVPVSVAAKMGFLLDWHVVGPFDAGGMKGFTTAYPPEKGVDLKAEYLGQKGKVAWKPYRVKEVTSGRHPALANLREAIGDADDAVAFAYAEVTLEKAQEVEFRGAADDNFTVFVNGKREFGFEEYRNGVRLDRHRFKVTLKAGVNQVLVKVIQSAAPNNEANWEFLLRIVDPSGQGVPAVK